MRICGYFFEDKRGSAIKSFCETLLMAPCLRRVSVGRAMVVNVVSALYCTDSKLSSLHSAVSCAVLRNVSAVVYDHFQVKVKVKQSLYRP